MNNWHTDIIIDYFEEKLSNDLEQQIDQLIAEDEAFSNWVDDLYEGWLNDPHNYRQKIKGFQNQFYSTLKKVIDKENEKKNKRKIRLRVISAAAAIFVGIIIVQLNFHTRQNCKIKDTACLINYYGGVYEEQLTTMNSNLPSSEQLKNIVNAYNGGDYQTSISLISIALEDSLSAFQKNELELMLGVSYVMSHKHEEALTYLNQSIKTGTPSNKNNARWYAALSYLYLEDYPNAIGLLEVILRDKNPKQKDAEDLLNRIE